LLTKEELLQSAKKAIEGGNAELAKRCLNEAQLMSEPIVAASSPQPHGYAPASRGTGLRCYECGKEIEDERQLVMRNVHVGSYQGAFGSGDQWDRKPFHSACWDRQKAIGTLLLEKIFGKR
jgi:hypothetical protein